MSINPQTKWSRRQIVETAQALLAGGISFIKGGRRISQLSFAAELRNDPDILPFIAIDSETDTLPIDDSIRKLWAPSALERLQPEIEKAESWAREIGLKHCQKLIDRFTEATLTALEAAVLREVCKQLPQPDRRALEAQLDGISVRSRRNTGAGFFTDLAVRDQTSCEIISVDTKSYDASAWIRELDGSLGFILWLRDGYVDCLEGYTESAGSTEGIDLTALNFELQNPWSSGDDEH